MKTARDLGEKPAEFLRTTGVSYATFQLMLEKVEGYVEACKEQYPIHRRGRKSAPGLEQALLLSLMYMRRYQTFLSLGQASSLSESYAHKRYCQMRRILSQVLGMPAKGLLASGELLVSEAVKKLLVEAGEVRSTTLRYGRGIR